MCFHMFQMLYSWFCFISPLIIVILEDVLNDGPASKSNPFIVGTCKFSPLAFNTKERRNCSPTSTTEGADAINSVFWANNLDPPKTHNSNMIMNDFICLSFNSLLSLWKTYKVTSFSQSSSSLPFELELYLSVPFPVFSFRPLPRPLTSVWHLLSRF